MISMTFDEVKKLAQSGDYKCIPLSTEIYSDMRTPIEVLRILQNVSSHCYMLESAEDNKKWGRYTFLGYDPTTEVTCMNGVMKITENGVTSEQTVAHPDVVIKKIIADHKSPKLDALPSFTGGLVGYFSYDYIKYSEPALKLDAKDEESFNDVDLMLFDKVIAFDNYRQKIVLIVNISVDDLADSYAKGAEELLKMKELILRGELKTHVPGKLKSEFRSLFSKEEYCAMVEKAKHYIREGDIFQVVLSNRLDADYEGSLLDAYRVLRTLNPSPYMFYFSSDDIEIAGASPETLVKLEDGVLHTFPLAGSRPRGADDEEDRQLEK
ncbi:MAG: chorismate-binding protein, partial [Oscillospiraceae bacterium]|nr:chorismate-binding protein [Oscillospiraceae bacterium]